MGSVDIDKHNTLYLIVYKDIIERIFSGDKTIEYREDTKYWFRRLHNRKYQYLRITNGYGNETRPYILMHYNPIGLVKRQDNNFYYAIHCDKSKWIEYREKYKGEITKC